MAQAKTKAAEEKAAAVATEEKPETNEDAVAAESNDLATVNLDDYSDLGFDLDELDDLTGIETINASDIRVPFAKMHAKTAKGIKLGDIELPDGTLIHGGEDEVLEGLSILKIQAVRVFFPPQFDPKNSFICRSLDGIKGAEDGEYAGRICATCEFAQYPEKGASPCREQLLLLCTLADGTMCYLLISGISVREFKRAFMSVEMMRGLRDVKKAIKKNILGALNITMSVVMEDTDFGVFPKAVFKVNREKPMVSKERLIMNLETLSSYKEFEEESVATAATMAQTEQGEYAQDAEPQGQNDKMF